MNLVVKIAWRNIMRHKGKSIVIGVILFLGGLLMTVGNGVISGMDKGLHEHIVNGFTGDIVLISSEQETESVFLDFMGKAVEPIFNYGAIEKTLKKCDFIMDALPVGKNMVMAINDVNDGMPGYIFVIGADYEKYQKMFPGSLKPIEGELLSSGERGILVPTNARKEFFETSGIWFKSNRDSLHKGNLPAEFQKDQSEIVIRDSVVLMGFNNDNSTYDIRLGIKGIVKYNALHTIFGQFAVMDIESYRECLGYFSASDNNTVLSDGEKALLNIESSDLDAIFGDDARLAEVSSTAITENPKTSSSEEVSDEESGVYNLVLLKIKEKENEKKAIAELNSILKKENLGVKAISWKAAMGTIGSMAIIIKGALLGFVGFLFFVAIIIIVNTLTMAALERTSEIGMMRAVGARKNFIRAMFIGETGILSFLFGGVGIAAGIAVVKVLQVLNFKSDNDMVQLLYGGDTFHPLLTVPDITTAIVMLFLVTVIAVVYPVKIASEITPLDAISRD
ncbi:MAG TPA: FtsX-like permease family protein [Chitinispirillaceae bacterium]|nr:FtsX-like permease family protein [Chitinispirillaceae bacterium]